MTVNLLYEIPALSVPVAFLVGRHDHTARHALVEEPEKLQRSLIELGRRFCSE